MKNNPRYFWTIVIVLFIFSSCGTSNSKKQVKEVTEENISAVDINGEYFLSDPNFLGNTRFQNFSTAKKTLKRMNYFGITEEIYCGCEFSDGKIPMDAKCGIKPRKNEKRAYRIEFEHIVPFENQVGHTVVWRRGIAACEGKKGRKCASNIFGHMEGDLWNLWPSAGELNADRLNYSYAMVQGPRDQYGKCDFKVEDRKAEPRDEVKALIAFTYMYFQKTYAKYLKTNYISSKNEKLFEAWSKFPLTATQCNWAKKVVEVQGNKNVDLLEACRKLN